MKVSDIKKYIKKITNDEEYTKFLCKHINHLEPKVSKNIYEEVIDICKENNFNNSYPWIIYNLGWIYYQLSNFQKSIAFQEEARIIFLKNKNYEGQLSTTNALVAINSAIQNFDAAIDYGLRGIELAENIKNYERAIVIRSNLAVTYIEMEEYQKARDLIEQIDKVPNISTKSNMISQYINTAECDMNLNEVDKALESIEKAYIEAQGINSNIMPAVLDMMGRIFTVKGLYELAEEKFMESEKIAKENQCIFYLNDTLLYWADLDIRLESYEKALEKLKKIEDTMIDVNSSRNIIKLYYSLNLVYKNLKDYEQAYFYLQKYYDAKIQFENSKKKKSVTRLDNSSEIEGEKIYKMLYKQTEELYNVCQKITSNLNKEDIFKLLSVEIDNLIEADVFQIVLFKEETNVLEYPLCIDRGEIVDMEPKALDEISFASYAIRNKQEVLINNFYKEYRKYFDNINRYITKATESQNSKSEKFPDSMIFVPIIVNDIVIGVISTQCYKKNTYTIKDINTVKIISTYLGIALENARLYKELQYGAYYDSLTNIFNRREVLRRINEVYNYSKNNNVNNCIIMIDIDNFKKINDTYGHQKGDKVISEVAKTIRESIKEEDLVGRYGGEEFIVVINDYRSYSYDIAERIRNNLEKINVKSAYDKNIHVTASIGVANLDAKNKTLEEVISLADKALYKAKNTGKNKVVVFR